MKMSQLRTRSTTSKVFMMSALPQDVRKDLAKKIHVLGGNYFEKQVFKASCTHVICGQLSRSEKFLGACATGKWVLHPNYITDSAKAGSWLDEEQYEWCDVHIQKMLEADTELSLAPRRWRTCLDGQKGAFSGWKVAVLAGAKKSKVIKRLLLSGGAEVFNLKMPITSESKVASLITYVFVSEQNVASMQNVIDYGVMCVKPEFIGDYLIKDPRADPIDYLAQRAKDESWSLSQNIFISQTPTCTGDVDNGHKQTLLDVIPWKQEMSPKAFSDKLKTEGKKALQLILARHDKLTSKDSKLQEMETKPSKQQIKVHLQLRKDEIKQNLINMKTEESTDDINTENSDYMLTEEQNQSVTVKEESDKQVTDNTSMMAVDQSNVQSMVTIGLTLDNEDDLAVNEDIKDMQIMNNTIKKEAVDPSDTHCLTIIDLTSDDDEGAMVSDAFTSESDKAFSGKNLSQLNKKEMFHGDKPSSQEQANFEALRTTSLPKNHTILENNLEFPNLNPCAGRKRKCGRRVQSRSNSQIQDLDELPEIDSPSVSLGEPHDIKIQTSVQDHCSLSMVASPLYYAPEGERQQVLSDVQRLPSLTSDFFEVMLEGGFVKEALHDLTSRISFKYYPDEHTLSSLMRTALLKAETELVANLSYQVLENIIRLHPPVTYELQHVYLQALSGQNRGGQWLFIENCIKTILLQDDNSGRNNMRLLNVIVHLLQCNLYHYRTAQNDIESKSFKSRHMLMHILWSPSYFVVANSRCMKLFDLMVDVIRQYVTMGQDRNTHSWYEVVQNVLWMVAMCADCSRQVECRHDSIGALHATISSEFVREISKRLIGLDLQTPFLDEILNCLHLPWLCVGICLQMLNIMDDYLVVRDHIQEGEVVNLHLIVNKYLYLLPQFQMVHKEKKATITERISSSHVGQQVEETGWQAQCLNEKSNFKRLNASSRKGSVNKRNPKGETPLQVACIKNDIMTVKRLLKEPGIDVNNKDNFGWTPLHEASNHGHIECVRELMRYVPRTTHDCYFNKSKTDGRVDLLVGNSEGITPLHDAVLNGRAEVCKILLQHGGAKLLEVKTQEGSTPLDLAETDEMRMLLSSFLPNRQRHSSNSVALIDCQDSTDCNHNIRMCLPRDSLYQEVLFLDGVRIYADTKSLLHYTNLVTLLITNYVTARNLTGLTIDSQKLHLQKKAGIECKTSSQVASSLEAKTVDDYSATEIFKPHSDSTEKENISFVLKEDLNRNNNNNMSEGQSSSPCSQNERIQCSDINSDLDVLKHAPQYPKLFSSHLERLCHPLDVPKVKRELEVLYFLFDYLHHL